MVGFPNKPMGFPTKNDHFGVFWENPPFKDTPISTSEDLFWSQQLCAAPGRTGNGTADKGGGWWIFKGGRFLGKTENNA